MTNQDCVVSILTLADRFWNAPADASFSPFDSLQLKSRVHVFDTENFSRESKQTSSSSVAFIYAFANVAGALEFLLFFDLVSECLYLLQKQLSIPSMAWFLSIVAATNQPFLFASLYVA